jgi:excisionase family DNA binding protein
MNGMMSSAEAAECLGVSNRRVRALIADGSLPAQRIVGRWVVPADAVSNFTAYDVGRPMSEQSAWATLRYLSGSTSAGSLPSRLRHRVCALSKMETPERKMRSWMTGRGMAVFLWALPPAVSLVENDDRVVLSGDRAVRDLEPAELLRGYVQANQLDALVNTHGLRFVNGDKLPNIVLWAISDLNLIPRSPSNLRHAAGLVAAIDLLDNGAPRAVGVARQIIEAAIGMTTSSTDSQPSRPDSSYADRRPYMVVDDLESLRGQTDSIVKLPLRLNWSSKCLYDLTATSDRRALYERVLNEALHVEDLQTFLDAETLVELWSQLWLPQQVRTLWEARFPLLASQRKSMQGKV